METKIKHTITIIVISLAMEFVIFPFRFYFGMEVSAVVGFGIYFILTALVLRNNTNTNKIIAYSLSILAGILFIQVPMRIIDFKGSLISLPDTINHILAVGLGICYIYSSKAVYKYGIVFLSVALNIFVFTTGYNLWLNKLSYDSFSGHLEVIEESNLYGLNANKKKVSFNNGKYTVLDLWFSSCGVCFSEFPGFEALKKKYQSKSNMVFYALNVPIPSDTIGVTSFRLIKERGYNFESLQAPNDIEVRRLEINYYPMHLIFNNKGKIIYKGDLNGLVKALEKITH